MYTKVKDSIKKRVDINEEELKCGLQYFYLRTFKKGEMLLRVGETCHFIGFLNKGMIMTTLVDDGNEKACNFISEGCFFTYMEGIAFDTPSHKSMIALEDCEALMMNKNILSNVFHAQPKFITLYSQLLAEELRLVLLKEHDKITRSAGERYLKFVKEYPGVFQRIPLKHLAHYLGIEPPTLSRLRKQLARKMTVIETGAANRQSLPIISDCRCTKGDRTRGIML